MMRETDQIEAAPPRGAASAPLEFELELGDGSRLVLDDAGAPSFRRVDSDRISLADIVGSEAEPFAGYRRLRAG